MCMKQENYPLCYAAPAFWSMIKMKRRLPESVFGEPDFCLRPVSEFDRISGHSTKTFRRLFGQNRSAKFSPPSARSGRRRSSRTPWSLSAGSRRRCQTPARSNDEWRSSTTSRRRRSAGGRRCCRSTGSSTGSCSSCGCWTSSWLRFDARSGSRFSGSRRRPFPTTSDTTCSLSGTSCSTWHRDRASRAVSRTWKGSRRRTSCRHLGRWWRHWCASRRKCSRTSARWWRPEKKD